MLNGFVQFLFKRVSRGRETHGEGFVKFLLHEPRAGGKHSYEEVVLYEVIPTSGGWGGLVTGSTSSAETDKASATIWVCSFW